jgi:hypothetical protein
MARRTDARQSRRLYVVHTDQLYTLEPMAEEHSRYPEPLGPLAPACPEPEPPRPDYGPSRPAPRRASGFFLDRYVY